MGLYQLRTRRQLINNNISYVANVETHYQFVLNQV